MVKYTRERFDRMFYHDMMHHIEHLDGHMKEDIPEKIMTDLENIRYVAKQMMEHIEHEWEEIGDLR